MSWTKPLGFSEQGLRMSRLFLLGCVLALAACKSDPVTLEFSGETMGTTYNVIAVDASGDVEAAAVQAVIDATLRKVNAQMSNWDPNSEISQFNAQETTDSVDISPEMLEVMSAANAVHEASQGQFDVTLGPLIEIWGFGARTSESPVPSDDAIAERLAQVGQMKVLELSSDPARLRKLQPKTSVYLAAIAKGYGVDQVATAIAALGMSDYMVEIGGDLVTSGKNPTGAEWTIGIERPDAGAGTIEDVVSISGLGMATSGDYRNYFEEDGVRYSHIIDAVSGRPITHTTASVTVLAPDAMMADAWATALLALGAERGMPIAEEQGLAALFITRDPSAEDPEFTHVASSGFSALEAEK
ncbi:FAD:protein FMN transferase [Roseobacteraceae bacterium S113]